MRSTESEYIALSDVTKHIVWLRSVLNEIGIEQNPTKVFEENNGALNWAYVTSGKVFAKSAT